MIRVRYLCLLVALWIAGVACDANETRPNIILIMADDLGWGDVGYNGNQIIKTPFLDAMSREGIRFNRFYAASAVCSPTRAACLTGRHPFRQGVYTANAGHLKEPEICIAELLQEQGYRTGHFGKWHLGTLSPDFSGKGPGRNPESNYSTPAMNGFDEWFSTEFAVATWDPYDPKNSHQPRKAWDSRALYWHNGENVIEPLTGDDSRIIMDRAIPFIEEAVETKQPFFSVIWFHTPHEPTIGGPEYLKMYPDQNTQAQHYFACITAMDEQIGRLRNCLDSVGAAKNTMLWFCSDNGPEGRQANGRRQGSAGPFRGRKRSLYEGGIRVPGILVWPDAVPQSKQIDIPCVTSDYFPTILQVLNLPLPEQRPYDGVSLLGITQGTVERRPRAIGFQHGKQLALVDDRFKLLHNTGTARPGSDNGQTPFAEWELYDLIEDPSETTNIIDAHADRVAEMKQALEAWKISCANSDAGKDYAQ